MAASTYLSLSKMIVPLKLPKAHIAYINAEPFDGSVLSIILWRKYVGEIVISKSFRNV